MPAVSSEFCRWAFASSERGFFPLVDRWQLSVRCSSGCLELPPKRNVRHGRVYSWPFYLLVRFSALAYARQNRKLDRNRRWRTAPTGRARFCSRGVITSSDLEGKSSSQHLLSHFPLRSLLLVTARLCALPMPLPFLINYLSDDLIFFKRN